jgi:hypothetical protein
MLEYTNLNELSASDLQRKLQGIKDHLAMVFVKVTPDNESIDKPADVDPSDKKILEDAKKSREKTDFEKALEELAKRVANGEKFTFTNPLDKEFERYLPKYDPNKVSNWKSPPSSPFGKPIIYC